MKACPFCAETKKPIVLLGTSLQTWVLTTAAQGAAGFAHLKGLKHSCVEQKCLNLPSTSPNNSSIRMTELPRPRVRANPVTHSAKHERSRSYHSHRLEQQWQPEWKHRRRQQQKCKQVNIPHFFCVSTDNIFFSKLLLIFVLVVQSLLPRWDIQSKGIQQSTDWALNTGIASAPTSAKWTDYSESITFHNFDTY